MNELSFYDKLMQLNKFKVLDNDVIFCLYDYFVESKLTFEQFTKLKIRKYTSLLDYNNTYLKNHKSLSTAPNNVFPYKRRYGAGLLIGYKILELVNKEKQ